MKEISPHFRSATDKILKNWTALQLAISQNAGGPNSSMIGIWMTDAVIGWFAENDDDIEDYEVAEFLETIMNQEFNVIIDDGSTEDIGKSIVRFYRLIRSTPIDEETILNEIRALPECGDLSQCRVQDEVSSSCPEEISVSKKQEPDADGWITVQRK